MNYDSVYIDDYNYGFYSTVKITEIYGSYTNGVYRLVTANTIIE